MKFNILYHTFFKLKPIATLIILCLIASTLNAQNSCGNDAGEPNQDLYVCFGESAFGNATGVSLNDPNSVSRYYLHNNNLANPIDAHQNGIFINNGNYPLNTVLEITGVAGPADQNGFPVLNDPCTDIQEVSTKVVFLEDVIITSSFNCSGSNAEINYSVDGGLPAFNDSSFDISGDDVNVVSANTNNSFVSLGVSGSYSFSATDQNSCEAFQTAQYDCQLPEVIDLALTKKLATGQAPNVTAGNDVVFQIEVTNQGNVPLKNIRITDYIPGGLTLADPNWTIIGTNAQTTLSGTLQPSNSIFLNITLNSLATSTTVTLQNAAEITQAEMENGIIVTMDSDGVFDNDENNNGTPVNDAINDPDDDDHHDIENVTIEPSEACLGMAGSMPVDTIFACFNDEITVSERSSVLDPNRDVDFYVLHESSTDVINPNSIIATNNNGTFDNPGNTDCRVFYVSYVFGPDGGDGTPDFSNECTIVLPGTPVLWLSQIVISSTPECANDGNSFMVNYIVSGGYPACFSSNYSIDGTVENAVVNPSVNIFDNTEFSNNSDYTISAKDDIGCVTTTNFDDVVCEDLNPCTSVAGSMPLDTIFACAGTTVTETEDGSILGDQIGYYYLHNNSGNSLGTIFDKNSIGEFDDIGNYCQTLFISYAIGPDNGSGEPNVLDNCATVLTGTPVIWASPIVIESDESCSTTNVGFYNYNYNVNGGFAECLNGIYTLSGNDISTPFAQPGFEYLNNTSIPSGSSYNFIATDSKGCSENYRGGSVECETEICNNFPGIMPSRIKYACVGESISSTENNSELGENDVSYYVLHEGTSNVIVGEIKTSRDGTFTDPGRDHHCQTLYISYVFGPDDGNNLPDRTSTCTKVLVGTPVIWSAPIEISTLVDCNEETEKFQFSYTLRGGFPSCINNNYYVTYESGNMQAIPGEIFTPGTLYDDGDTYSVDVTDEKGCTNNFISEPIACQNPNPCGDSDVGEVLNNSLVYLCAGESVTLEVDDNFVDNNDVEGYILHIGSSGIGVILSQNTNGTFEDPQRPCEILSMTYVIGPDNGNGFPDIDDPCSNFSSTVSTIWYPPVEISSNATCDETTGNLIVNYTVGGGASVCEPSITFAITGDVVANGITAGSYMVNNQLSSDQSYQIIATDFFECTATFNSELIDCDQVDPFCGNVLGAMQFANQTRVCAGIKASAEEEGTVLADDAIGQYFLHTNSDNTLGTIINSNNSGQFADPGTDYSCDTLYISYVIGPDNGDNTIDLNSECTFVLPGEPVVWAPEIELISSGVNCNPETGEYRINYSLSGGFPECFTSIKYDVSGTISGNVTDSFNENGLSPDDHLSDNAYPSGTSYQLTVEDDRGCTASIDESDIKNCPGAPEPCSYINFPGSPKSEEFACSGANADGAVKDVVTDLYYELFYILHDGVNTVGEIFDCNGTGIYTNDGSYPRNEQLYISSVVSIPGEDGKPDFDDDCTLIMLPGTPVVFLEELQIFVTSVACDTLNGSARISYRALGGYPAFNREALYTIEGSDVGSIRIDISKEFILNGNSYDLTVSDGIGGCSDRVSDGTNCANECLNELGAQPEVPLTLCEGERINAAVDNFNLVDSAQLFYILYNETIDNIIDINGTGIFINDEDNPYPNNVQLNVSAAIGNLDANGGPDFSDPCLQYNVPGTPVTFLPVIDITTSCSTENDSTTVKFVVTGGSGQYTVTGDYEGNLDAGILTSFTFPEANSNFTLNITDDNNCTENLIFETIDCDCDCDGNNSAGTVSPFDQFICGEESVTISAQNTQVDEGYMLYYFLHDGFNSIGNIADFNTTGLFINNGQYEAGKQYYISSVVTTTEGNNPNINDCCLTAALPGTSVTFYSPVTVSIVEEVCNNNTGDYTVRFSINGGAPAIDDSKFYNVSGIITSDYVSVGQVVETIPQSTPEYIIVVEDDNNCSTTFEKNNVVCNTDCPQFNKENIVNVISPNGDGINDSWSVPELSECYPNHRITICNRWGSKVSEIENCVNDCWGGTVSGNGEPLPTGAYYYIIELNGENSTEDQIVTGSITLLR